MEQKENLLIKSFKYVVALISMFSAVFLTSCGPTNDGDQQQTTSQQSIKDDNDDAGTGDESSDTKNNYSDLLNYVLNNSNYKNLIDSLKKELIDYSSPFFDPNPYAFYDSKNFDVKSIKNGRLKAHTIAYTVANEPNNLYMVTYCADSSNKYYNEYMLRYTLTEKEMAEYKMIHENRCIQAVFMNDAISATKSVEVLNEAKCGISAHDSIADSLNSLTYTKDMLGAKGTDILLKDFDEATQKFSVYIFPNVGSGDPDRMTRAGKIGIYYLSRCDEFLNVSNGVFYGPISYPKFCIDEDLFDLDNPAQYAIDATWYYSANARLSAWRTLEI